MILLGTIHGIWLIYDSFTQNHPFLIDFSKSKSQITTQLIMFISMILYAVLLCRLFFVSNTAINSPWLSGLMMGWAIGIIAIPLMWIIHISMSWLALRPITAHRAHAILAIIILVIYFVLLLPTLTTNLAERTAKADYDKLPIVVVTSEKLPHELSAISLDGSRINVKLLLINNDWILFFVSKPEAHVTADDFRPTDSNILYMMRLSDIKYISSTISDNTSTKSYGSFSNLTK